MAFGTCRRWRFDETKGMIRLATLLSPDPSIADIEGWVSPRQGSVLVPDVGTSSNIGDPSNYDDEAEALMQELRRRKAAK